MNGTAFLRGSSALITFVCASLMIPGVTAQTVRVNWKTNTDFSAYKTYAWRVSPKERNSFYLSWVRTDVDKTLAAKGLKRVSESQNPDMIVAYHFVTQEVMDATTTTDGFGFGDGGWGFMGGWGGWGMEDMGMGDTGITQTEETPRSMGILTLDFADAKKKLLIWRGQATEDSVSNSQKGDEKQVLKSVDKMLKQFPPKKK
jgi:hypothetical protein